LKWTTRYGPISKALERWRRVPYRKPVAKPHLAAIENAAVFAGRKSGQKTVVFCTGFGYTRASGMGCSHAQSRRLPSGQHARPDHCQPRARAARGSDPDRLRDRACLPGPRRQRRQGPGQAPTVRQAVPGRDQTAVRRGHGVVGRPAWPLIAGLGRLPNRNSCPQG
jgi:hypothetical protein